MFTHHIITLWRFLQFIDAKSEEYAQDACRFIANFDVPIFESVPHIYLSALPWAPDNSLVSTACPPHFSHTMNIVSGKNKQWLPMLNILRSHHGSVTSVAFSSDGTKVVSGSSDQTVRIWDATSGQLVAGPLEGHTQQVRSVGFSPDGTKVVSGSWDQTVRIWDATSGQLVAGPFQGHNRVGESVGFYPGGNESTSALVDKKHSSHVLPYPVPVDWERYKGIQGDSGWISFENARMDTLLMHWMPPNIIRYWYNSRTVLMIGAHDTVRVSYEHFLHGNNWTACQTASCVSGQFTHPFFG
ncbi:hypothetical protein SERLA73DRAFT_61926 [Serpula lacrymans var. lacrymans S7.3]|uniref:Uncharacterized protein n=1 Tax=Serpula lacrymans var. lacrymans (strain S7.3) TaxID=936435 RepID=F8QAK8_SERL3|nr:hypothetical protein SERLA73DRAFT_61926 [Serpula lacrymans var. lacrymans S7.3]